MFSQLDFFNHKNARVLIRQHCCSLVCSKSSVAYSSKACYSLPWSLIRLLISMSWSFEKHSFTYRKIKRYQIGLNYCKCRHLRTQRDLMPTGCQLLVIIRGARSPVPSSQGREHPGGTPTAESNSSCETLTLEQICPGEGEKLSWDMCKNTF